MNHPPILIVDDNDQPVGKASFKEVDEQGLIRRIVRLMLENKKGQILLQKRSETETVYPGRWDNSVAGHVDFGETNEQALMRESLEELGIKDINPKKIGSYYNEVVRDKYEIRKFNHLYKADYEDTPKDYGRNEVSQVKWFNLDEIKQMIRNDPDMFTDGVVEVIMRYY
jgi:isopentenyldiphosphate isomerase